MDKGQLLHLSQADVVSLRLIMAEIIEPVAKAFLENGEGRGEMSRKPGIHPAGSDNFIHAMPICPTLRPRPISPSD
jgi:hypothetical protein